MLFQLGGHVWSKALGLFCTLLSLLWCSILLVLLALFGLLHKLRKLRGATDRANNVFHVMCLTVDETAEVQNHPLGLIALPGERSVGVLQGGKLLLIALPLTLKLLGNLLLQHKRLQGVITLLLGARQTECETCHVVLLLVNEATEAAVLSLVVLDLDFELSGLLRELLCEGLELEELGKVSIIESIARPRRRTCCFQVSSSSTKKLLRLVTLLNSVSMRPLRLIKSCQASIASREYWLRSRTISLR